MFILSLYANNGLHCVCTHTIVKCFSNELDIEGGKDTKLSQVSLMRVYIQLCLTLRASITLFLMKAMRFLR